MFPSTHLSLLADIAGDSSNRLPWERFVTIYEPALRRWLTKRGLSPHDAEDCTQQVLMAVSRSIRSFRDDNKPASFRRWIQRIARNELINSIRTQSKQPQSTNDSFVWDQLASMADESDRLEKSFDDEYQRSLFFVAAAEIKQSVAPKTWQAFWMSQVESIPTPVIAKTLGMSVGSVYVAKGRVLQRLQAAVAQLEELQ
jgi:RNA polymerase sigma-70 factor (ECF subfamily)